jgi:hypothetical protein
MSVFFDDRLSTHSLKKDSEKLYIIKSVWQNKPIKGYREWN